MFVTSSHRIKNLTALTELSAITGRYNLPPVWNNIIKERLTDGAGTTNGGGPGLRNSVSVPVVSNTIRRLRHTDEGCSDSRKLCKCCQIFYPVWWSYKHIEWCPFSLFFIKSHHVMMTFLVFDLDVLFIPCY